MKRRKGMGLIVALIVTLVGGLLIGAIYDYVNQYAGFSVVERAVYVDHTTLASELQAMKGRIISDNKNDWKVRHAPALNYDVESADVPENLTIDDLRFGGAADADKWRVLRTASNSGVGSQQVEVEVFDMFFDPDWIDPDEFTKPLFPSAVPRPQGIGTPPGGVSEMEATDPSWGGGVGGGGGVSPETYGAYLMRASLYNSGREEPVRVVEEVFIQSLPSDMEPE